MQMLYAKVSDLMAPTKGWSPGHRAGQRPRWCGRCDQGWVWPTMEHGMLAASPAYTEIN
jgi:hypothetical protein